MMRSVKNEERVNVEWYAAHVVMAVEFRDGNRDRVPVFENIFLVQAAPHQEAQKEGALLGKGEEGDSEGSFMWDGRPAFLRFAGIRKTTLCADPELPPKNGTEITYSEFELSDTESVSKFLRGEEVTIRYID
jgi:hypothetical protein